MTEKSQSRKDNIAEPQVQKELEKTEATENKKFRFANQYCMLTYKSHIEKKSLRKYFEEKFKIKEMEIAHEVGKSGEIPYPHTHIVINFGRRFQSTNQRIFDLNEIHPHIAPFKRHEWGIKINYISKEDPENAHLKKTQVGILASKIWSCQTVQEALLTVQTPSDVNGVIALFNNKPTEEHKDEIEFRPWQSKLWERLQLPPDDRKIIWICDKNGGAGKSRFTKWMNLNNHAVVFKQFGGTRDSASIIADAVARGWDQRVVICDLARNFEDKEIYTALECLKDGMVTTTKYVGKTVAFKCPHVVVFANFWPNIFKMSKDRWVLWELHHEGGDGAYNIKEAPLSEAINTIKGDDMKGYD